MRVNDLNIRVLEFGRFRVVDSDGGARLLPSLSPNFGAQFSLWLSSDRRSEPWQNLE